MTARDQSQDATDLTVYDLAEKLRAGIRKSEPEIMISIIGVAEVAEALLASRDVVEAAVHWDDVFSSDDLSGDVTSDDWQRDDQACVRLSEVVRKYVAARDAARRERT